MKIFYIPEKLSCVIFDIDSTLYTNPAYAYEQVDVQIRHFARIRGITDAEARSLVEHYRSEYEKVYKKKISLGNTLVHFGISIAESIRWREELLEPVTYLSPDITLQTILRTLTRNYALIAVTNNPVLPARKTLDVLGVTEFFPHIIGLDTVGVSKPHEKPFREAAARTGTPVQECLAVGDRYDIDIALPLELGMGGILVDGVKDVYKLPNILSDHC